MVEEEAQEKKSVYLLTAKTSDMLFAIYLLGFDKKDYLPKLAQWADWYDDLANKVEPDSERVRTYWYSVEHIDFLPYKYPDPDSRPDSLKRLLYKHIPFRARLNGKIGDGLKSEMKIIRSELFEEERRMRRRFEGWKKIENGIALKHNAVEFRRSGSIRYDLFKKSFGTEKEVDVKLAVDLLQFRPIYETAIIVSGDQDYVPAVEIIKDAGKRVVNVAFETRNGKLLPGGAWRLNQKTDRNIQIRHTDFQSRLFPPTP